MDLIKEFEAQRLHGGKKSWYTGATFLPGDSFVLVDYSNSRCCLYDSACNFVSEISFSATPWDVCHIKGNIIAISFPHKNKIEFLAVNRMFESLLTVNTKRACYGLSSLDEDRLVFSGYNNEEWRDCWGVIDKNGEEKFYHELQGDSSRDQSYVALNETKTQVYVTWSNRRVLQCFRIEGDFKFSIELTDKPHGVCVHIDGSIFVLGHSSNNIHQISPSGELLNEISKDIPRESCKICTSLNKTYILITNRHKDTRDKCFIYFARYRR
ncbi:hypothetical protein ACJMK2_021733 [Sinanodonta woodiana]|uniref:Uncharacterized protein n=1 Tax=Sinanodonta woodiana TaxID=1069815 RepID=A0ABD3TI57_SINWO